MVSATAYLSIVVYCCFVFAYKFVDTHRLDVGVVP